jgi:DNA segregation ATPase FtsK/SpoIIIE-like protein
MNYITQETDLRELCRRLYVELFHVDQQLCSITDEDDEPVYKQGSTVRDVLKDASAALAQPAKPVEPLTNMEVQALYMCREDGRVSVSKVQRVLQIGYNEAGRLCQSIIDKGQCDELQIAPSLNTRAAAAKERT